MFPYLQYFLSDPHAPSNIPSKGQLLSSPFRTETPLSCSRSANAASETPGKRGRGGGWVIFRL